ncbi:MAG: hypothetical protein Tsb008_15050 [Rhodothalassiaceae bacterium]
MFGIRPWACLKKVPRLVLIAAFLAQPIVMGISPGTSAYAPSDAAPVRESLAKPHHPNRQRLEHIALSIHTEDAGPSAPGVVDPDLDADLPQDCCLVMGGMICCSAILPPLTSPMPWADRASYEYLSGRAPPSVAVWSSTPPPKPTARV